MERGAVVYSEERKFLVPIPTFSGVPLVYPPEHEFAGKTIQYQREGAQGVRWWNSITNEWQGVASDDTGVIIINQVTEPEALQLQQWLTDKVGDPSKLYAKVVLDFINFAKEQTAHCVYNATRQDFLRTVDPLKWPGQTGWAAYGLHQRKKDDLYRKPVVQPCGPAVGPHTLLHTTCSLPLLTLTSSSPASPTGLCWCSNHSSSSLPATSFFQRVVY